MEAKYTTSQKFSLSQEAKDDITEAIEELINEGYTSGHITTGSQIRDMFYLLLPYGIFLRKTTVGSWFDLLTKQQQ
jgi:hypothetical protein